jgi:hypothetical protein
LRFSILSSAQIESPRSSTRAAGTPQGSQFLRNSTPCVNPPTPNEPNNFKGLQDSPPPGQQRCHQASPPPQTTGGESVGTSSAVRVATKSSAGQRPSHSSRPVPCSASRQTRPPLVTTS